MHASITWPKHEYHIWPLMYELFKKEVIVRQIRKTTAQIAFMS